LHAIIRIFKQKRFFREYGINLLDSISSTNIEEGRKHAKELGYPFVIKIQVPVGGRGKAGGIQKCQNDDEFDIKYPQVMDLELKVKKQEQFY
jgi:succinyl-CoA synthetase (ADP-forming) beta subunit (EC 6.2.1.5)